MEKHNTCPYIWTHGFSLAYIRRQSTSRPLESLWNTVRGVFAPSLTCCRLQRASLMMSFPAESSTLTVLPESAVSFSRQTSRSESLVLSLCSVWGHGSAPSRARSQTSREVLTGSCASRTCSIASRRTCGCKRRAAAPDNTSWNDPYRPHLHRETWMLHRSMAYMSVTLQLGEQISILTNYSLWLYLNSQFGGLLIVSEVVVRFRCAV